MHDLSAPYIYTHLNKPPTYTQRACECGTTYAILAMFILYLAYRDYDDIEYVTISKVRERGTEMRQRSQSATKFYIFIGVYSMPLCI